MSLFKWVDRHGGDHLLENYQPIFDEIHAVESEIDGQLPGLENTDRAARDRARQTIENRRLRLVELQADVLRWNAHADAETRNAAAEMLGHIEQLGAELKDMDLLVRLYDEHSELLHDGFGTAEERRAALAGIATPRQMHAISLARSTTKPVNPTRAEAWKWLNDRPQFQRSLTNDGGWFTWIDPNGYAHRLVDTLAIEQRAITCLIQLQAIRGKLEEKRVPDAPDALFESVERAAILMKEVNVLKLDLERFNREAEARDLAKCRSFAADWRSRKKI